MRNIQSWETCQAAAIPLLRSLICGTQSHSRRVPPLDADRKFDMGIAATEQQVGHGSIRVDLANNGIIGGAYQVKPNLGFRFCRAGGEQQSVATPQAARG
jgi:hypothetical protein